MTPRRSLWIGTLSFGAAALLLLANPASRNDQVVSSWSVREAAGARIVPLPPLSPLAVSGVRSAVADAHAAPQTLSAQAALPRETRGRLHPAAPDQPLEGLSVTFSIVEPEGGGLLRLRAVADWEGAFSLHREGPAWADAQTAAAEVRDDGGTTWFRGVVALAGELDLWLRDPCLLVGRVRFDPPQWAPPTSHVSARVRQRGDFMPAQYAGRGAIDAETGDWRIHCGLDQGAGTMELAVALQSLDYVAHSLPVPECNGRFLELQVPLARLALTVQSDGDAVPPGVSVIVRSETNQSSAASVQLDEAGRGHLVLFPDRYSVSVLHPERVPAISRGVELFAGAETSYVLALGAEEERDCSIEGSIVAFGSDLGGDRSLAGASIVALPEVDGSPAPDMSRVAKTDELGRFSLALARSGPVLLRGYVPGLGATEVLSLTAPARGIQLRLMPTCLVRVDLLPRVGHRFAASSGAAHLALVDFAGAKVRDEWVVARRHEIHDLVEGPYNAFAYSPAWDAYGHGSLEAVALRESSLALDLGPALWIHGRVLFAESGAPAVGAEVVHEPSIWPTAIVQRFGTVSTDSRGEFRVLTPYAAGGAIGIRTPCGRRWSGVGQPGEHCEVTLLALE
ncbi:MAG: hypothetical protein GC161_11575 [Planctomycetaceae bacterium]|nr:hypothetical protein [Planctomycetaceae bacterium]